MATAAQLITKDAGVDQTRGSQVNTSNDLLTRTSMGLSLSPIAYIMSRFPRVTETFILRELLELERQGQPVIIFPLLRAQQSVRHTEVDRLRDKVHYTPFLSWPILAAQLHYLRRSPRQYMKTLWSVLKGTWGSANLFIGAIGIFPKSVYLARWIEERGIKHVHAHFATHPALAALIISQLSGVSFSFTAHAHDIFVHTKMLGEKMEKARFVVTISEFNKQYLLRLCPQIPASKITVVRCGIELERYGEADQSPSSTPLARDEESSRNRQGRLLTILCVASLQPYKGIEYLVKACALLAPRFPHLQCLIVGEGDERRKIERLISRSGLSRTVHLLGARPQHKVAALLAQADLFVLPSVVTPNGQMEGLPVALMEAMASRLPVVATRLSGIPELVQDGVTGLLVPPGDAWALARAIALLGERPLLRQQMGRRGREKVARDFQLTHNVARLRALFSATLHQPTEPKDWRLELQERIKERSADYYPGFGLHGRVQVRLSRLPGGRDSEVYEVALTNGQGAGRQLVLKRHRPAWARPEEALQRARIYAQREYEALSWLWPEFSRHSTHLAVPRPLDHLPEYAAVVVEKCQGEKLSQALRWARWFKTNAERRRLRQQVKACGQWLTLFHQVTGQPGNPSDIYQRIEREFYNDLKSCEALGLESALVARVAAWFEQERSVAFSGDHQIVGYHGDFGPYNVLLSPDKITVIDFEGLREGILYDDLCYFLGMIEAMPGYHLSRQLSQTIKESFLEGYGQPGRVDSRHLTVFMVVTMVKIMAHSPLLTSEAGWRQAWKRQQRLKFYTTWFGERVE